MTRTAVMVSIILATSLPNIADATDLGALPTQLQDKIETAAAACSGFDDGTFSLDWGAISRVDLDGDHSPDWVLNEAQFLCSSAASLYCGTGGCMSHFLVGDQLQSLLNRGWNVVTFGMDRVVLADVHGSACGGINPTPCVSASVWDQEDRSWRSTTANWVK